MANTFSVDFDPFASPALLRSAASTESQRELWTASRLGGDASAAFNEAIALQVRGELDRDALSRAFHALVASHEALHTSFSEDGTSLLVEEPSFEVAFADLQSLSESDRAAACAAAQRAEVTEPFDLSKAPLCRAKLLRLAEGEHLLLFTAHHIVCDGWSMSVLLHDLGELYSSARGGAAVAPLSRPQFTDYAEAERTQRATEEQRTSERYWLGQLAGELPVVDLPNDHKRPRVKTFSSDRVDHVLEAELVTELKALSARQRASFFVTLLSGFQAFVHRLTAAEDLVVGIFAAGQSFTDRPTLVGHCVNMLPVRVPLATSQPFTELLDRCRRTVLDAREHQALTYGALLKKLVLPRDASRLPLVSFAFNVDQAVTGDALRFSGLQVQINTIPRAFENFEVFINAAEKHGRVVLETQYNTDLFERATVERWLEGFEVFLRAVLGAPQSALSEFSVLTPREARQQSEWNARAIRPYAPTRNLAELIFGRPAASGSTPALHAIDGKLSYDELDQRSQALARELRRRGIGRGSLVGISLERSSRLLVSVLAVLRSGAAYVPLDPSFPSERLRFMVDDARLSLLLSERNLEGDLPSRDVPVLFVDDATSPADDVAWDASLDAGPEDPAYVIYTSGSTGKPKGVVVPQRAAVNFLRSMAEAPGLGAGQRLLAVTTLSFDISVLELLLPLCVGATVVLATSAQAMDGMALRSLIGDYQVNVMQATPATWRLLLAAGQRFGQGFKALCGGEPLPKALAQELVSQGAELWNMYGPTETTVWSTCQRITADDERITIGRPIANTQIYVVDEQLRPVPVGVTGELCIAGDGVALGYWERPELTRERFVKSSLTGGESGGLLYRTGDHARFLSDGRLECLGRGDGQVKLRGYRIELGEIETVLSRHPDVRQAVALVREDRAGDQRLVAYVVPRTTPPDPEALRLHLRQSVPDYMVPQHFVEMAALPLTPNGKVDKKKLPAPAAQGSAPTRTHVAASTDGEQLVEKIWQKVLGLSRPLGTTEDFFQLGGHSLLVAQVLAQISRETGIELSMRRFFEAPTISALAALLEKSRTEGSTASTIPRDPARKQAPPSAMQERLWFMEEMNPGTSIYNLPSCFRLKGTLDVAALRRSLDAIAARHSTLRTSLGWQNGVLVQTILPEYHFELSPIDLRGLPALEREERLHAALTEEAERPFALSEGPLARASLYLLNESESAFFFMPHHAVWDGWSFDIFLDELDRHYAAFSRGESPNLPAPEVSYGDFAAWHKGFLSTPEVEKQTAYWLEQLSGELPILELPTDRPRPASVTFDGATEAFDLDATLVDKLTRIGQQNGATFYMVLLAAFDVLLFRLTGQTDVIVGTPVRGRMRPELEPLIGYFVNALPLRTRLDGTEAFSTLLGRVRTTAVDALGNQDTPLESLVQRLKLERDTSRTPLYSAFFSFQDVRNRKSSVGELSYEQIHIHAPVSPTDLSFWVKQLEGGVAGGLDYATDLFDQETVRRWLESFRVLLEAIADGVDLPLCQMPFLAPREREALAAISRTERAYPTELCLHQLIEAQVDRTPDAIAVVDDKVRLSYAELDQRANRLARALVELGAGPGRRVGLCLERGAELVVAALAVMKSGAAYVPLDPAFPAERLAFMAEDAELGVIVLEGRTKERAPRTDSARVLELDVEQPRLATLPGSRLAPSGAPNTEAPAYVIYTSGSTGRPKGVILPHRSVVNFVTSMVREPGLGAKDRLLAVTTLSFDIAVLELYAPLIVGARVVVASREVTLDGDLLGEAIESHDITVMQATPSTWRLLLATGFREPSFKALCGGEAFPRDLAEQLLGAVGEVWNMYGPTETTVWSTCKRLEKPLGDIRIGRPIANTTIHVVDVNGQLVPWGSVGELWIGGQGVALGYLARPELTRERFVENPFAPGMAYRTGDLVRLRGGGELAYLRRNDNQIKLRGYRIELGEIEVAIAAQPGVAEAVAIVREDRPGDQRLVAYMVARTGAELVEANLRTELRVRLPEYMIPQHFVVLERLPLTPNGKVDRQRLPSPSGATSADESYVAPSTDMERTLATLWQEILNVPRVSARDNFFDIGGHSLLCLQMTVRIEQLTGEKLNPRIILRNNLSQVAALLDQAATNPVSGPPSSRPPVKQSLSQKLFGRFIGRSS